MTNKYLEKIAGIAGRTIQAVKGADNVFKASIPMRDAVVFMKANKKPLAIGAGLGLAGGMAAWPEKQAAEHDRNIIDASKIGIGAAYGGSAGFFANEYIHSRRVNKFMNTITPGNIAKATPSQLLDAVEGLERIGAGKVPKPKLGRVGAVIGGGVMLGKVLHDRFTKKANYEENEMTNKYLEKIAAHYNLRPHSMDEQVYGMNSVSLNDAELNKYHKAKEDATPPSRVLKHVGVGAAAGLGTGAAYLAAFPGLRRYAAPVLGTGGVLGTLTGLKSLENKSHDEAMAKVKANKFLSAMDNAHKKQASEEDRGYVRGMGVMAGGLAGSGVAGHLGKHLDKSLQGTAPKIMAGLAGGALGAGGAILGDKLGAKIYDKMHKQAAEKWIQGAIKHPGALHKALGVPADEKIPAAKLHAAAKKGGKIGREARLAETLKGMRHDKK